MVYRILIPALLLLWAIDAYLTTTIIRKYGPDAEENPVLKTLLRHNIKDFLIFKLLDAIAFVAIIYLLISRNEMIANILLAIFMSLYLYVNWKNYSVYKELG